MMRDALMKEDSVARIVQVLCALLVISVVLALAAQHLKPARLESDALTPVLKDPHRHANFLYRIKQGPINLLFIGDSITDGWPRDGEHSWLKFAPYQPADFGISGDRTEHVLWRLENGELDGISPKVIVLMISTNNIGHFQDERPEWAAAGVAKIVKTIQSKLPSTRILLLGVFPRGDKQAPERARVSAINQIISKLDDGSKVRYLDIGKAFMDENGELPADIMPDKLHLSPKGYDLWYDAINPLLAEMMK